MREILKKLSQAPDTQIDKTITPRLRALSEQENPDPVELKGILDECANASLASDFSMRVMDIVWKDLLKKTPANISSGHAPNGP